MMNEKETTRISKFLSLVLRHQPGTIGIQLDQNGWTDVETLLQKMNTNGFKISRKDLDYVVSTNNKKRFAYNEEQTKIRASQGHSVEVDLAYVAQKPPMVLFHGSTTRFVDAILEEGLKKGSRHHVHLSIDIETATKVGQRHGKPALFEVAAGRMFEDGFEFFVSENNVWLTDHVPSIYLKLI